MSTDYGIKSSIDGEDVLDFQLDLGSVTSQYPNHKIKLNQSPAHVRLFEYTVTPNVGTGTRTILTHAHGYSYAPAFWLMGNLSNYKGGAVTDRWQFLPFHVENPGVWADTIYAYTDDTNLYIKIRRTDSPASGSLLDDVYQFKYMIFAEDGV